MIDRLRYCVTALFIVSLVLPLAGCGKRTVRATGKVVQNGQPIQLSDKGVVTVIFFAEGDKTGVRPFPTDTKTDGTFTILGPEGKGVPTGKYRASVEILDPYPTGPDKLGGKYKGDTGGLPVEVGRGEIVLDVGK